ncbi:DivIVA domain-containing protein [Demequina capsici]|uniref:Cell wall synthesis protein Wag31 n=1 Tax=Demequina capsici TaxID=3075620 RepID=A0AA96J8I2_9MICO|nr:DivIVA domain-containing protein [Demequina sp. PMTSA13]WNM26217.1 DivIVA domain-containing protein [Demequina sp. PMTSA13]
MALLTAEDVLNKAFSKTKYREGFDQDEVDDFLDEVAHTISVLTAERDDLAQRLSAAQAAGPVLPAVPVEQPGSLLEAATDPGQVGGTEMVAMAQKLQDEYVRAGEEERDRIIDDARAKAEEIVRHAESDASTRMDQLAHERSSVERKIDDLRRFERDYRARLKTYLENLLGDLDHGGVPTGVAASGPAFASVAGMEAVVAAAASEEAALGVGEDTVGELPDASAEEAAQDDVEPEGDEAFEPAADVEESPYVYAPAPVTPFEPAPATPFDGAVDEADEAPVEEPAAPAWSAAMPSAPQDVSAPSPEAVEPEPVAYQPPAASFAAPAPYQPRVFAAPDEAQAPSGESPAVVEAAPAAPARPSLFGAAAPQAGSPYAPQVASPYTPEASTPQEAAPAAEAQAFPEPPRYEAPVTQATPLWAPTTQAFSQASPASAASVPSAASGEGEEESPKSDIYDIRSIFGDVAPKDDNS